MKSLRTVFVVILLFLSIKNYLFAAEGVVIQSGDGPIVLPYMPVAKENEGRIFRGEGLKPIENGPLSMFSTHSYTTLRPGMWYVKNQGSRGTCNVFTAIGLLESKSPFKFSEQCLAWESSSDDAGLAEQRIQWALDHGLYLENQCKYFKKDDGRNIIPPNITSIPHHRIVGTMQVIDVESLTDPITFIKQTILEQKPVAIGFYAVGRWWENFAWAPYRSGIMIGNNEDRTMPKVSYSAASINLIKAWSDRLLKDRFKKEVFDKYSIVYELPYRDGSLRKNYTHKDFEKYFSDLGPLEIPSEEEISASCRDKSGLNSESPPTKECSSHAVIVTGFDETTQVLEFKNSWGYAWKHDGFGYMKYDYFRRFYQKGSKLIIFTPSSFTRTNL